MSLNPLSFREDYHTTSPKKKEKKPAYLPFTLREDSCTSPFYRFEPSKTPRQRTPITLQSRRIYYSNHLPPPIYRRQHDFDSNPESTNSLDTSSDELASSELRAMKHKGQRKGRRLGLAQNKVEFGLQIDDLFIRDLSSPTKLHQSARTSPLKTAFKFNKVRSSLLDEIGQVKHMIQSKEPSLHIKQQFPPHTDPIIAPQNASTTTTSNETKLVHHRSTSLNFKINTIPTQVIYWDETKSKYIADRSTSEEIQTMLVQSSNAILFSLRGELLNEFVPNEIAFISIFNNNTISEASDNQIDQITSLWNYLFRTHATPATQTQERIDRLIRFMNAVNSKEELQQILDDTTRFNSIVSEETPANDLTNRNSKRRKQKIQISAEKGAGKNSKRKLDPSPNGLDAFNNNHQNKLNSPLVRAERKNMVDMYSKYSDVILQQVSKSTTSLPRIAPGSLVKSFNGLKMKILQLSFPLIVKQQQQQIRQQQDNPLLSSPSSRSLINVKSQPILKQTPSAQQYHFFIEQKN